RGRRRTGRAGVRPADPRPRAAAPARLRRAAQAARARQRATGADPHRRRQHRAARQGLGPGCRRLHGQAVFAAGAGGARARADAPRARLGIERDSPRPSHVRRERSRGLHPRPDDRAVRARAVAAGGVAAAGRPLGQQGPAGRASVRVGRRGQQQRDRGLHPSPSQEDRAGTDPHRHRARARLLPREDRGLSRAGLSSPMVARDLTPLASSPPAATERRSLFGEILDWMLAPLLLLWPMSLALTYAAAQNIASQPYDRALSEMARTIGRQIVFEAAADGASPRARLRLPEIAADVLRADDLDRVYFRVLGPTGEHVAGDPELAAPEDAPLLHDVRLRDDEIHSEPVRIASLWVAPGGAAAPALVQVAETLGKRSRLATEIIKGVIIPQFVILPLAVLLVWLALARGIRPLNELQQRIRRRRSEDLSPIDER